MLLFSTSPKFYTQTWNMWSEEAKLLCMLSFHRLYVYKLTSSFALHSLLLENSNIRLTKFILVSGQSQGQSYCNIIGCHITRQFICRYVSPLEAWRHSPNRLRHKTATCAILLAVKPPILAMHQPGAWPASLLCRWWHQQSFEIKSAHQTTHKSSLAGSFH